MRYSNKCFPDKFDISSGYKRNTSENVNCHLTSPVTLRSGSRRKSSWTKGVRPSRQPSSVVDGRKSHNEVNVSRWSQFQYGERTVEYVLLIKCVTVLMRLPGKIGVSKRNLVVLTTTQTRFKLKRKTDEDEGGRGERLSMSRVFVRICVGLTIWGRVSTEGCLRLEEIIE